MEAERVMHRMADERSEFVSAEREDIFAPLG